MKFAKEVKLNKKIMQRLEQVFAKVYTDFVFKDIFEVLAEKPLPLQNAIQDELDFNEYDRHVQALRDAFYKGAIYYKDGNIFPADGTKFGLKISKAIKTVLQGKYNKSKKSYKIDLRKINATLRADIAVIDDKVKGDAGKIQAILQEKQGEQVPSFDTEEVKKAFDSFAKDLESKTSESLRLGINEFSKENIEKLRAEYIETAKYYVENFNNNRLPKIREKLAQLTLEKNLSHRDLFKYVKEEFGLCDRRCKFIARQESKLVKAEYIQEKATSNGYTSYMWETAHDEKVRDNPNGDDHKSLDGKIFKFEEPPVVDHKTNRRANPAQDYNCRCVAKVIVKW